MTRCLITYHNESGGMFGMVKSVLSALMVCDQHGHKPTVVVEGSPYRPEGFTGNVWDLFFEPIGDKSATHDQTMRVSYHPLIKRGGVNYFLRQKLHKLMVQYVRPLPATMERIERCKECLRSANRRIGVHYRGTDHHLVQPYLPPNAFDPSLDFLRANEPGPWLLCTDTTQAVTAFARLPGMFTTDVERLPYANCSHGVHLAAKDKLKVGSDAILDAWLLSTCHAMVCRESNLADVVTYLNPDILRVTL